jgi:hypothetical protein
MSELSYNFTSFQKFEITDQHCLVGFKEMGLHEHKIS